MVGFFVGRKGEVGKKEHHGYGKKADEPEDNPKPRASVGYFYLIGSHRVSFSKTVGLQS
jgi:hypothetical protein